MTQSTERLSSALADRYRILSRLGEGGMATVYLAEDLKHKRQVGRRMFVKPFAIRWRTFRSPRR